MKVLAVLGLASADVSHLGYHYKVPQTSYGVPSYQVGGDNGQYHSGFSNAGHGVNYKGSEGQYLGSSFSRGDQGKPSHLAGDGHLSASSLNGGVINGFGNSGSSFASGLGSGYANGYNTGYSSSLNSGLNGGSGISSGQYYQTVGRPSTAEPIYLGKPTQYQTTQYHSGEKYQQFYQVQSNEPAQVYKHFYVHSAPEELELPKPRTPIVVPPPQKHYKIIFVKTPNTQSHSSQIVPVQPQNEEKTIVYVLVKKPEENHEVIVPKVEQKPPTKPEVYFIKYNNKEGSQAVINNIVNDYNKHGQSVTFSTDGSESSPVLSGIHSSHLEGSGYTPSSASLSDVSSSSVSNIPNYQSGGFSSGFTKYPSSFSNSNQGSAFHSVPSSVYYDAPSSSSTGSSSSLFNKFGSPSNSNSGLSGSSSTGFSSGFHSDYPIVSSSGLSSGSGLSSSFIGSSQSDSLAQVPIVSSSISSQSVDESNSEASDAGADANSLVNGATASSHSTTTSGNVQDDLNTIPAAQGLPHETYGVPKFRIV